MNELQIVNHNGVFVTDSREVAEMVERPHNDLMKSIRQYCEYLTQGEISLSDFFIENIYKDSTGRILPCYLITKKGCDMVANKMTGEKGVLFTAAYVTKFDEMEKQIKGTLPTCIEDLIIMQAQAMKNLRQEVSETKLQVAQNTQQVQTIKDALLPSDKEWRKAVNESLNKIAKVCDADYQDVRFKSYQLLEQRGACSLSRRVKNLKDRLGEGGATKTVVNNACKLDAIEADKRLKEIYGSIVREMVVKYVV